MNLTNWHSLAVSSVLAFLENLSRIVLLIKTKMGTEFLWEEVDAAVGAMMPFGTILDCHPERTWNLLKNGFAPRQASSLPKVRIYRCTNGNA